MKKYSELPKLVPLMPTRENIVFPYTELSHTVSNPDEIELVNKAIETNKIIGLFAVKEGASDLSKIESYHSIGTAVGIQRFYRFPGNILRLRLYGIARVKLIDLLDAEGLFSFALIERTEPIVRLSEEDELFAWVDTVKGQLKQILELSLTLPDKFPDFDIETNPDEFSFTAAGYLGVGIEEKQRILDEENIVSRLQIISEIMSHEIKIMLLRSKIQGEVREEIEKDQKEYILKEQLKAIQKELGSGNENPEALELKEKLKKKKLTDEVRKTADSELSRLARMHPGLPEVAVIRNYIEWILALPWLESTEDLLEIERARKVLEEDHYDLEDVKQRILEFIAVRKLNPIGKAPILCFVGPPGVGKTSMGKSIARAIGREFVRMSLGGVHDEAEIRGHRRTYIGAMPGKIIQGLKEAGSCNPVFMLDEIDKLGSDFRGDPTSALLEVLDPEQNYSFRDNYLNVAFDLSAVQFITTANRLDTIPVPLRDRMEIIRIPGYTEDEKFEIARRYLIPKRLENTGLSGKNIRFNKNALLELIRKYTREAGVRELERQIGKICRKVAMRIAEGNDSLVVVSPDKLHGFLGAEKFMRERGFKEPAIGISTALAWMPSGGEILLVETIVMDGSGNLKLTGQLGDVMKESAQAALSWIRVQSNRYKILKNFQKIDIHLHVPAGATPKDGPSAGAAIAVSMISALTSKAVTPFVALTGEITLHGRIMPVGGIKEKALGALSAGITKVIIPKENLKDLEDIPENIRTRIEFIPVEELEEVIPLLIAELKGSVKE